jgi:hypothetical protein
VELRNHLHAKIANSTGNSRSAYFQQVWEKKSRLPFDQARIGYRNLTRSNDSRTMIPCLLPPGVICSHQASILVRRKGSEADEAYLLAILSSIPFDWYTRKWVELTLSFEILNSVPIPNLGPDNPLRGRIAEISGRLAAKDERFLSWAKKVGVEVGSVLLESEKELLLSELNSLVALAYGLNSDDVKHIYQTFHKGWEYQNALSEVLKYMGKNGG